MTRCTGQLAGMVAALMLALGGMRPAEALPIPGVFSTGVDGGGAVLPGGFLDPHYIVVGGELGPTTFAVVDPVGLGWVGNTPTSAWISGDPGGFASPDTYTYTIIFNLAGFDPATAVIAGQWAADDEATMFLNGNPVSSSPFGGWAFFTPFSINDGFLPAVNTLTFEVPNSAGPSGLHVQIVTADVSQISAAPEPASVTLLCIGILAGIARRRGGRG